MTNHKHTPGPWEYCIHREGAFLLPNGKKYIGTIMIHMPPEDNKVVPIAVMPMLSRDSESNAQLIAAAPDMLFTLQAIKDSCEMLFKQNGFDYHLSVIEQAISKATGGK